MKTNSTRQPFMTRVQLYAKFGQLEPLNRYRVRKGVSAHLVRLLFQALPACPARAVPWQQCRGVPCGPRLSSNDHVALHDLAAVDGMLIPVSSHGLQNGPLCFVKQ